MPCWAVAVFFRVQNRGRKETADECQQQTHPDHVLQRITRVLNIGVWVKLDKSPWLLKIERKRKSVQSFLPGANIRQNKVIWWFYCELSESFRDELARKQAELSFHITGILVDTDVGAGDFSLKPFCQTIYRTSEMFRDDIVRALIKQRA